METLWLLKYVSDLLRCVCLTNAAYVFKAFYFCSRAEKENSLDSKVVGFGVFASVVLIAIERFCFAGGAGMDAGNQTSPFAPSCKFSIGHK